MRIRMILYPEMRRQTGEALGADMAGSKLTSATESRPLQHGMVSKEHISRLNNLDQRVLSASHRIRPLSWTHPESCSIHYGRK